jgi:hypothetical protein
MVVVVVVATQVYFVASHLRQERSLWQAVVLEVQVLQVDMQELMEVRVEVPLASRVLLEE